MGKKRGGKKETDRIKRFREFVLPLLVWRDLKAQLGRQAHGAERAFKIEEADCKNYIKSHI